MSGSEEEFDSLEDMFAPRRPRVTVRILGRDYQVPRGITLLRVFQYLELEAGAFRCDYSKFCWNDSCDNCSLYYIKEGKETWSRSCQLRIYPGLEVTEPPQPVRPLD